MNNVLD